MQYITFSMHLSSVIFLSANIISLFGVFLIKHVISCKGPKLHNLSEFETSWQEKLRGK